MKTKDEKEETTEEKTTETTEEKDEKKETDKKSETEKSDEKEFEVNTDEIAKKVVEKLNLSKDGSYTAEQVSTFMKEVSKNTAITTKNQLYGEITRLKDKVTNLSKEKTSASTEDKAKIETEKSELKAQIKVLEDAVVEVTNQFETYKDESKKEKLADYRTRKIKEAGGKLVEEMVTGTTVEEIDASIEKAKNKFKEVEEGVRKNLKLPTVDESKTTEEQDKAPIEIQRLNVSDPKALQEYKKNRKTVLDDVYRRAGFPKKTF